jgi:hypothetical protein
MRPAAKPTPADALAITMALRTQGSMAGRQHGRAAAGRSDRGAVPCYSPSSVSPGWSAGRGADWSQWNRRSAA